MAELTRDQKKRQAAVKSYMDKHGLNQEQLAAQLSISKALVSSWNRKTNPIPIKPIYLTVLGIEL